MIRTVRGNLLEAKEDIIVHQVNCQGVMGAGLAKQIREQFPKAYEDYIEHTKNRKGDKALLGTVLISEVESKHIAHVFGQYSYGRSGKIYTSYEALFKALTEIRIFAESEGKSVAIPFYIGCGLGGGDWSIVSKLIEKAFHDGMSEKVTIYRI